jgi:hypothetical protein
MVIPMVLRLWHLLVVFGALACLSVGFVGGMLVSDRGGENHTRTVVQVLSVAGQDQADDDSTARANVRAVIPALEAYNADNTGTGENAGYTGVSVPLLAQSYDSAIANAPVTIPYATSVTYCVESTVGSATWRKAGPGADIEPGSCE